jgi:hypothetical protein
MLKIGERTLPVALSESDVSRLTVILGDSPNAPDRTTHRESVNPSGKEYSTLSIPIVTAGEIQAESILCSLVPRKFDLEV